MNILYVHSAGPFGGSSRSLYEMISAIPESERESMKLYFLSQAGSSCDYFSRLGGVVSVPGLPQFDHGSYSSYRGLRWLVVLREILYFPFVFVGWWRLKKKVNCIDVVHINDFVSIFSGVILRFLFRAKLVVHVRCLVSQNNAQFRTKFMHFLLRHFSDSIICIDECVRRTLPEDLSCMVVHNGLNVDIDDLECKLWRADGRDLRVGFVGNLLLQKGILEFLEAAKICRDSGLKIAFHVYGDAAKSIEGWRGFLLNLFGLKQDVKEKIFAYVSEEGLHDVVEFHGFSDDLSEVYQSFDVICFPSHLNATGRPVIEAAIFGRPSIVAIDRPTGDTLVSGETGVAVPAYSASALAEAFGYFSENNDELLRMGEAARSLAARFYDQKSNSLLVYGVYVDLVGI